MISGQLSIMYGLKGPNLAIVTACTTGTIASALAGAHDRIRRCRRDDRRRRRSDASRRSASAASAAARALSTRNDDPASASRPWDKDRDGFVLGEGAGVLVLEEYEHAKARGARIYCRTRRLRHERRRLPHHRAGEDGEGAARAWRTRCAMRGINPEEVDYVNAHGTSTPLGDIAETHRDQARASASTRTSSR